MADIAVSLASKWKFVIPCVIVPKIMNRELASVL